MLGLALALAVLIGISLGFLLVKNVIG